MGINAAQKRQPTRNTVSDKDHRLLNRLLFLLLVFQPFLDAYILYDSRFVNRFTGGFSLSPIFVVLYVGILTAYLFFKYRGGKTGKFLLIFAGLCVVYFIAHHLNCMDFTSYSKTNFNYDVIHEAYYVARLIVPMLLIYAVYEFGFSLEGFLDASCVMGFIMGVIIVGSNLLGLSMCSYTNEQIHAGIWGWFDYADATLPKFYASKGIFSYANQVSVVFLGLVPIVTYRLVKKPSVFRSLTLLLIVYSMIMLGTQVATLGAIAELVAMAMIAALYLLFHHKGVRQKLRRVGLLAVTAILIVASLAAFVPRSPAVRNMSIKQSNSFVNKVSGLPSNVQIANDKLTDKELAELYYWIEFNYPMAGIAYQFIIVDYNYKLDPQFWKAMINPDNYTVGDNNNYRSLEARIIQRISNVDGSPWNRWLGISATREANVVKIERDITAQYYSMGIIGVVLFFGAYFLIILASVVSILLRMIREKRLPLFQLLLLESLVLMIVGGYYCGNSLDGTFLSTYLGIAMGQALLVMRGTPWRKRRPALKDAPVADVPASENS